MKNVRIFPDESTEKQEEEDSMKIGAMAESLRIPRLEALAQLAALGVQGVQMYVDKAFVEFTNSRIAEINDACRKNGLVVSAICGDIGGHPYQDESHWAEHFEFIRKLVATAVKLNTKVITTHIGVVPEDVKDPVFKVMKRTVGEAAAYAAKYGVTFAIETGPEKPETLIRLIKAVHSKGLGVNLDPANLRMVSCVDPIHAVEILGKYIVHTHAKDGINMYPGSAAAAYGMVEPDGTPRKFTEKPAEYQEVPLGKGQVPWDGYLAALKKAGYDGFLTIERECGADPKGDIKLAIDFLKTRI